MGRDWTEEQKQVIHLRDCNLLVSAAAGSGKTAVLVERILALITEGEHPLNVDELLVVTFTKAAAAEMRERIGSELAARILANPENEHLQRQQCLLRSASITTIDSFCMQIVREYFHLINLDPGFRIGDETENELMRSDVIGELLEECYEEGEERFLSFAEDYAPGKTDERLEGYILRLYQFAESYPWPEQWLERQKGAFDFDSLEQLEQSELVRGILADIRATVTAAAEKAEAALAVCLSEGGPAAYAATIREDTEQLMNLYGVDSFQKYCSIIQDFQLSRLSGRPDKDTKEEKKELVKSLREKYKKSIKEMNQLYCFQSPEEMLADMKRVREPMQVLIDLALRFREKYSKAKAEKNLLDFNDLEHYALSILLEKREDGYFPSTAAESLQERYAVIMVDEYQDSNLVQETLLSAISRENRTDAEHPCGNPNVFMVGDVKQSIYRFRLARPELFMQKYETYHPDEGVHRRIDLHKNFRSRPQVLEAVNSVFEWSMRKSFGRIEYDAEAALYAGLSFPEENAAAYDSELILLCPGDSFGNSGSDTAADRKDAGTGEADDTDAENDIEEPGTITAEAYACAKRIKKLTDPVKGLKILENGKERLVNYSDIAILFRTTRGWTEEFVSVLSAEGIPVHSDTRTGFFAAGEVTTVLDYLRILDNPRQDIPLTAVLRSPLIGLSNDELARLREFDCSMFESIERYTEHGTDADLKARLNLFLQQYRSLRERERFLGTADLIRTLYETTGLYEIMSVLPAGEKRAANLSYLQQQAAVFETTSYHGLFHFVRYIEKLLEHEIDYGEALPESEIQAVRIMSIHKSKGLEFPVVFVPALGKRFNASDSSAALVLHPDYGLGPDCIDGTLRTKIATLQKQLIKRQIMMESKAEELRILYVAMTRARDKLILVGSMKKPQSKIEEYRIGGDRMDYLALTKAGSFLDFAAGAVFCHMNPEHTLLLNQETQIMLETRTTRAQAGWTICLQTAVSVDKEMAEEFSEEALRKKLLQEKIREAEADREVKMQSPDIRKLKACVDFQYPYEEAAKRPIKLSVSELKYRAMLQAEALEPDGGEMPDWMKQLAKQHAEYGKQHAEQHSAGEAEQTTARQTTQGKPKTKEQKQFSGSDRGTLYHKILELLPIRSVRNEAEIRGFVQGLIEAGRITAEEETLFNYSKLEQFLTSSLAERMRAAEEKGCLHKEQPFVLGIPEPGTDAQEDIQLVQGIIDLYFEEEDGLVLADYKTDAAGEQELVRRYRTQLAYYARALEQITGKPVKERLIYAFSESKVIPV